MRNIPKELLGFFDNNLYSLKEIARQTDSDGTVKFAFITIDGYIIETVLMDYQNTTSICISSQAGCKQGCKFCATGFQGFDRDLNPAEMTDQIFLVEKLTNKKITNIVVMGMGEPFDNYNNLKVFLENITNPDGCGYSRRAITISTCGILKQMDEFIEDFPQIGLAISLHSANEETRASLMPISKKYCIKDIIEWGDEYYEKTKRRLTYEYLLIRGVNDSLDDAKKIARLLKNKNIHINLINLNKVEACEYIGSDEVDVRAFKKHLESENIPITLRRTLGSSINAACGQLKNTYNFEI
jgi:23S rRNA (adenine2503-C2)-methyltransferase